MRGLLMMVVVAMLIAGCGGGDDSTSNGNGVDQSASTSGAPDPCTLADDSVLAAYFGDATPETERSENGPILGCSWRDANANSLLIQVATNYDLFRPDPCDGCAEISFGDDGYASESPLQSSARVVSGSLWVSVTTTGFRDDNSSITSLLETVFQYATN